MNDTITPIEIIYSAKSNGIKLFIDHGKLAIRKSKNVALSNSLMNQIKENKEELINFLKNEVNPTKKSSFQKIRSLHEASSYDISNAQKRIWLASQIEEGSVAYNIPNTIVLDELYDIYYFKKAVHAVIDRHEILRTIFKIDDQGIIKQHVLPAEEMGFSIDFKDFRGDKNKESLSNDYIRDDSHEPFDLEKGPLIRICLLQLEDDLFIFYYNIHHIISDGWSVDILSRDIMAFYNGFLNNSGDELPQLDIQYKDYAAWQLEQLNSLKYAGHKEYWLNKLSGEIPTIDFPTYGKRPSIKTYNGRSLRTYLSKDLTAQLEQFIKLHNGNLFILLLSVLDLLIYKYTSIDDITIGAPTSGRAHPDLEDQIGFYVNNLVLRNQLDPNDSFVDFYKKVRDNTLEDFGHQEYPFDLLIEELGLKYDQSRTAMFDISWELHNKNTGVSSNDLEEGSMDKIESRGDTSCKCDIEFHGTQLEDIISFKLIYNEQVYTEGTMIAVIKHFKQLLSSVMSSPKAVLDNIEYLSQDEQYEILEEYNATQSIYPENKTILDVFSEQVDSTPNKVALVFKDRELTYKELDERSNELANYMITVYGIEKGDFIGVHLDRSENNIISLFGIMKCGGVYIPIDTAYPADRKKYLIEDSKTTMVIIDGKSGPDLDFYEGAVLNIESKVEQATFGFDLEVLVVPNDLAYVIYTSGSTGRPKGVMIEHKGVYNSIMALINACDIKESHRASQFLSFSFDASISEIFTVLLSGATLYIIDEITRKDPNLLGEYIQNNGIDLATLPPSYFKLMNIDSLKDIKVLITGGEVPDFKKVKSYLSIGGKYYNAYGPSETSICASIFNMPKDYNLNSGSIPIGTPIANTSLYILDNSNNLICKGTVGELCVGGKGLARGYLNRPNLTEEKFIAHPFKDDERLYKTGDLARWLPDGNIEFKGRIDNQVKINGFRIELGEIKFELENLKSIQQAVVLALENEDCNKQLVAYVVLNSKLNITAIYQELEKRLPDYMVPRTYIELDEIPLTRNGKIDQKALPMPDIDSHDKKEYVAPWSFEEKMLAEVWAPLLNIEKIGAKDHFNTLGGNSIKAIQLLGVLKKQGYNLQVKEIMQNPVLEDMAMFLKEVPITHGTTNPNNEHYQEARKLDRDAQVAANAYIISENQKYFIDKPWAMIPSHILTISNFSRHTFESKFKSFIASYPSLMVNFEKNELGGIIQSKVTRKDIKVAIDIKKSGRDGEPKELAKETDYFLNQPFDYFNNSALIRIQVVIDETDNAKAYVKFCIAHALLDVDTFVEIAENIENGFKSPDLAENASNIDFALWQDSFLKSNEAVLQRKWWLNYLTLNSLKSSKTVKEGVLVETIVQRATITGDHFISITETAIKLGLPITTLLMGAHQLVLNEINCNDLGLQLIAVNGREDVSSEMDISKVSGLTTNFLPLHINASHPNELSKDYLYEIYEQYINIRLHQKIPFEIIKKDFYQETKINITRYIDGYFNFFLQENRTLQSSGIKINKVNQKLPNSFGIGFVCVLYNNGISIRLTSQKETYDASKNKLCLKSLIENKLMKFSDLMMPV